MPFLTVQEAVNALKRGDLVAIPTETVYGLAAAANNPEAIRQIFKRKQRPLSHPLIVHVKKEADLTTFVCDIPDYAHALMAAFWPGPLSLVLPLKPNTLDPLITGGQTTVAVRSPQHPLTEQLLSQLDFPLVAPSANPFMQLSPTTAAHVQAYFPDDRLGILDGGRCTAGIESTIVRATDPKTYQILRHGVIDAARLQACLSQQQCLDDSGEIAVPGQLQHHYQPQKTLYSFDYGCQQAAQAFIQNKAKETAFVFSFQPAPFVPLGNHHQWPLDPDQMAYQLYYQLHLADQSTATYLMTELPPPDKAWAGLRDRLIKASVPLPL